MPPIGCDVNVKQERPEIAGQDIMQRAQNVNAADLIVDAFRL